MERKGKETIMVVKTFLTTLIIHIIETITFICTGWVDPGELGNIFIGPDAAIPTGYVGSPTKCDATYQNQSERLNVAVK